MKKVLVVDDNRVSLAIAADILQEAGYEISLRGDPIGTGAVVLREQPDVVLVDVNMQGLSGDMIVKIIQEQLPSARIPALILYSEMPKDDLEQLAERCGADGFATKSGGGVELLRTIEDALRSKSAAK